MKGVLTSVALSLCLFGCSDSDSDELELVEGAAGPRAIPGCDFDYSPCDVREESCQLEKLAIAACVRGDDPGELPLVSVMTEAEFSEYVASDSPRPVPDYWEQAYVMLGLVEPGGLTAKKKPLRSSHEWAAFYRWQEKDVVLIDRGEPLDGLEVNATLVHEFVHALQDREVDLEAFALAHAENDDVYLAAKSVPEGEAWLLEDQVRAAMLGVDVEAVDWGTRLNELVRYGEDWVFEQPSLLVAAGEVFPYMHGARYLYPRWREGGKSAVLTLFANPPASSKALMLGDADDAGDVESAPFPELTPRGGIEHYATSNLGALGLYLFLAADSNRPATREAALTLRHDEFSIYVESATEHPIVVWSVEAAPDTLSAIERRVGELFTNGESHRSGERLRVAASKDTNLDLSWAVEGEL